MHRNPIGMPYDDWQIFYKNVETIPSDQMGQKIWKTSNRQKNLN